MRRPCLDKKVAINVESADYVESSSLLSLATVGDGDGDDDDGDGDENDDDEDGDGNDGDEDDVSGLDGSSRWRIASLINGNGVAALAPCL